MEKYKFRAMNIVSNREESSGLSNNIIVMCYVKYVNGDINVGDGPLKDSQVDFSNLLTLDNYKINKPISE